VIAPLKRARIEEQVLQVPQDQVVDPQEANTAGVNCSTEEKMNKSPPRATRPVASPPRIDTAGVNCGSRKKNERPPRPQANVVFPKKIKLQEWTAILNHEWNTKSTTQEYEKEAVESLIKEDLKAAAGAKIKGTRRFPRIKAHKTLEPWKSSGIIWIMKKC